MTYEKGQTITAQDFNNFRQDVVEIYGVGTGDKGYGQTTPVIPIINPGDVISNEWKILRDVIDIIADHQGVSVDLLPLTSDFDTGEQIIAFDTNSPSKSFVEMINLIRDNKFETDNSASTTLIPEVNTITQTSSWGNGGNDSITKNANISFSNEDNIRFFFNSGGEIKINFEHPNGSSPQDSDWRNIFNNIGDISLKAHSTTNSGSVGSPATTTGYYELTSNFQTIYNGINIGNGAYSSNDVIVEARTTNISRVNNGNGSTIEVKMTLRDQHSNSFSDNVSSGTEFKFDILIADVVLSGIEQPTIN